MNTSPRAICALLAVLATNAGGQGTAADPFASFPQSRWIQSQQSRYGGILTDVQYSVLVPPLQVNGSSLDAVGRSLIARRIAAGIDAGSKLRVADPSLVERALGEPARHYARDDLMKLARATGASIVVLGRVGYEAGKMDLEIEVLRRANGGASDYQSETRAWRGIPFNDTQLPEDVAGDAISQIVGLAVGTAPAPPARRRYDGMLAAPLPQDFDQLQKQAGTSPLTEALYLSFLGELVPATAGSRVRDQFFERSLVALDAVSPDSPGYRWLRARDLANLNRRPAAVAALGKPSGSLELAMAANLSGDLPALDRHSAALQSPLHHLLSRIDLADIRGFYSHSSQAGEAEMLAEAGGAWSPMIYRRATATDAWANFSALTLKVGLDALVPGKGLNAEGIIAGAMAEQRAPEERDFTKALAEDIDQGFRDAVRGALGTRPSSRAPYIGDVLEIAQATMLDNCLRQAITERQTRARPEDALQVLRDCDGIFADHPALLLEKAQSLTALSQKQRGGEQKNLAAESREATRRGFVWSGQESRYTLLIALVAESILPEVKAVPRDQRDSWLYSTDFPGHPFRVFYKRGDMEAGDWQACLAYTQVRFECLSGYYDFLRVNKPDGVEAVRLVDDNRQRFIGHPDRVKFLADVAAAGGDAAAGETVLRQAVEAGTGDWDPYYVLGRKLMQEGKPAAASTTFLRYPGFRPGSGVDRLLAGNQAYDAGSVIYWMGQYEAARPLYEFAAAASKGSGGSQASTIRLALLDGNLELATEISLERAQRYDDEYAYRDYMSFLHLQDRSEEADALFDSLMQRAKGPWIWDSQLVGQRMRGSSLDDVEKWAARPLHASAAANDASLAPRFLFIYGTQDRAPVPDLAERIARLEQAIPARERDVVTLRSAAAGKGGGQDNRNPAPVRSREPLLYSRHGVAANGLAAIKAGNYAAAFGILDALELRDMDEFLPDYAWAAALSGNDVRITVYLEEVGKAMARVDRSSQEAPLGVRFDEFLARASLLCAKGQHPEALKNLELALNDRPHTEDRSLLTEYRVADIAFRLYEKSRDDRYRKIGLDFARRFARMQPHTAWAYAMVARYTTDEKERLPYMATAMKLDRNSWNLSKITTIKPQAAEEWLKRNPPLYLKSESSTRS